MFFPKASWPFRGIDTWFMEDATREITSSAWFARVKSKIGPQDKNTNQHRTPKIDPTPPWCILQNLPDCYPGGTRRGSWMMIGWCHVNVWKVFEHIPNWSLAMSWQGGGLRLCSRLAFWPQNERSQGLEVRFQGLEVRDRHGNSGLRHRSSGFRHLSSRLEYLVNIKLL